VRERRAYQPSPANPRLVAARRGDRTEWWTESVGSLPPVYGEAWTQTGDRWYRSFEPSRSKLAAGLAKKWTGPLPRPGERWLYLGAASGTTASHVADLVGPTGRVYAIEPSLRPFARLLGLAERWPNLWPILGDGRAPRSYGGLVPPVHGIYADVAQPDQVEIVRSNADLFLAEGAGAFVLALKTASMGRDASAPEHLRRAEAEMGREFDLDPSVRLDPFHRGHYLVGGSRGRPERPSFTASRRPPEPRRARRRP
jgi:fibrillarin-like rRNA methylase